LSSPLPPLLRARPQDSTTGRNGSPGRWELVQISAEVLWLASALFSTASALACNFPHGNKMHSHSHSFGPTCGNQSGSPFVVLTFPSLCAQQEVSAPHWQATFHCPDQFLALRSSGGECPSLAGFLSPVQPFCIGMARECVRGGEDGHMVPPPRIPTERESKRGARSAWERRAGTAVPGVHERG
jgi:hypothetical protein